MNAPQASLFAPAAAPSIGYNFRLLGNRALAPTWKGRAADNIAAIKLARRIAGDQRPATPAEQERLIRFTGFGATELAQNLFPVGGRIAAGWERLESDLRELLPEAERAALARTTQYAHYTPEFLIRAIWRAVKRLGFTGGAVLEPGCGSGLFLALMPEGMASRSSFLGIEYDPSTAAIARLIHPEADILCADFARAALPGGFDLAIGNPPFSSRTVHADDAFGRLGLSLHDYFIARSIAMLRPGAIAAFVVSRYTLDKASTDARETIAGMADLLGAVRLPEAAMRADAGTDVVVDLLFFQRRDPAAAPDFSGDWIDADAEVASMADRRFFINRYFAEHPEMVLGRHAVTSSQYGPAYTVLADQTPLDIAISEALAALPAGVWRQADPARTPATSPAPAAPRVAIGTAADHAAIKEGSYFVDGDHLWQVVQSRPVPVLVRTKDSPVGIFGKHARIIRGLVAIRDAVRAVLRAQMNDAPWHADQARLQAAYDAFTHEFGPINRTKVSVSQIEVDAPITVRDEDTGVEYTVGTQKETREREITRRPNLQPFYDDPDCWLVASIEEYDEDSGRAAPGPIFTRRVVAAPQAPAIASASDALAVVLNERGRVDLDRIAELRGADVAAVLAELDDAVFFNPETQLWETADAYLSGLVRSKLAAAQQAAETDRALLRNVAALEAVQPADLPPSEITARLGAPWIPQDVVEAFAIDVLRLTTAVLHDADLATWTVNVRFEDRRSAASMSEWGTRRRTAGLLLEDALNNRVPKIYDETTDAQGRKTRELNVAETEAAKDKLGRIKSTFEGWIFRDPQRTDRCVRIYNDTFNNLVPRAFNGKHLKLTAASDSFVLREHQMRAAWRIIATGNTYMAHVVGAGKTAAAVAAIMEQRRLGLIAKPIVTVPGHTLAQWAREWLMLYPTARILVADETNFAKAKRAAFLARAATGDWDGIIITHSAFGFIPTPAEFERQMILEQLDTIEASEDRVNEDDRITRKRIEQLRERMEAKLRDLATRKDDMLTIAEMGIDQIVVDEAQAMRRLSFFTNDTTIKGVDPDGSQRAWDLYVKTRFVATRNPGRELIMMSGTPITNTMGEMFTLLRFMGEHLLRDRQVHEFDAWAAAFGSTVTALELQPSGHYRPVTRFAEFINVPELISMFRTVADVLGADELGRFMDLPAVASGPRQIVTAPAAPAFRAYQRLLGERIKLIRERRGPPKKGDDIILTVITDGRHAAIDMRFVDPARELKRFKLAGDLARVDWSRAAANDPANKLNLLVANLHRIWRDTADREYVQPGSGVPYALKGAAQMVFCDLGTEAAEQTRQFSAYTWIRSELIRLGVPVGQIAFMQDHKKSEKKQRLFNAVNAGQVRILIGSSETMGTGVNAQQRLIALHHLDVPWIPSNIEQREGRIVRQGNQNKEVQVYAYATLGSMDAPMWQLNERKARFISAALAGDSSIRRIEDIGASQADQFAMAKAIASGDPRLMQKAGLEAELARLERLQRAHIDDQHAIRHRVANAADDIKTCEMRIPQVEADLVQRTPTRGDAFVMELNGEPVRERSKAGAILLSKLRIMEKNADVTDAELARIGGFAVKAGGTKTLSGTYHLDVALAFSGRWSELDFSKDTTALGLLARIEHRIEGLDGALEEYRWRLTQARKTLADYQPRVNEAFAWQDELAAKRLELETINDQLEATTESITDLLEAA